MGRQPAIGILDLGASGGRVFVMVMQEQQLRLIEIHRFTHTPQQYWQTADGGNDQVNRICWDLGQIYAGMLEGLARIGQRDDLELVSFGVDTWGSDGTWMNSMGDILFPVGSNRDRRWEIARQEIFREISKRELFHLTGVRSDPFCVLNQVYWYARYQPQIVEAAATYMSINGLLHYYLCGEKAAEHTWMSTTQLSYPGQARYHEDIFARLELPLEKMAPLLMPGTRLGTCHAALADSMDLPQFQVILPATHDTAAAYAAAPIEPGTRPILISSGTWTLVGIDRPSAVLSDAAYDAGLTNIAGHQGMVFHCIIMGTWPAQSLRRLWSDQDGQGMSWEQFDRLASGAPALGSRLHIDDPVFYAPPSMEAAMREFCAGTGQASPTNRGQMARAAYEGLAAKTALACDRMQTLADYSATELVVVGGPARNVLLNQWLADASGLPVRTGSPNAAALGNGLFQARALGWIGSVEEGRQLLREEHAQRTYHPHRGQDWASFKRQIAEWQTE